MISVGLPKEIKAREKRVALTPEAVAVLIRRGISVLVESGAGIPSDFSDEEYRQAGATVARDKTELYRRSGLIQKVKEPLPPEYPLLRKGQILFCFLHLASPEQADLLRMLLQAGVTSMGYETVGREGWLPILAPMSELAGGLAAAFTGYFHRLGLLEQDRIAYPPDFQGELEAIAAAFPKLSMHASLGTAVVFGGGNAGRMAYETLRKIGCEAILVEADEGKRQDLKSRGFVVIGRDEVTLGLLERARILIGCAHSRGRRAPLVIDEETFKRAAQVQRKIIADVAIDQGGNFPSARSTSYDDPLYKDREGNLRLAVANMPSLAGRRASEMISEATLDYTAAMAENFEAALQRYPELKAAVNTEAGVIRLPALEEAHPFGRGSVSG